MTSTSHLLACALALIQLNSQFELRAANPEYESGSQKRIKLNLGFHVPPIMIKMPRLELPQLTMGVNLMSRPHAKPMTIQMPPLPQVSFGESYGGVRGYGASAPYDHAEDGGYEGDQYSSSTDMRRKAVKMQKKSETQVNKQETNAMSYGMPAYGSAPVPTPPSSSYDKMTSEVWQSQPLPSATAPLPYPPPFPYPFPYPSPPMMADLHEAQSGPTNEMHSPFMPPPTQGQHMYVPIFVGPMPSHPSASSALDQPSQQSSPSLGASPSSQAAPNLPEYPNFQMAPFPFSAPTDAAHPQGYLNVERPNHPQSHAQHTQIKPKTKQKLRLFDFSRLAPAHQQQTYQTMPQLPAESAGHVADEMYRIYPRPPTFPEQMYGSVRAEEELARSYHAAPRAPHPHTNNAAGPMVDNSKETL